MRKTTKKKTRFFDLTLRAELVRPSLFHIREIGFMSDPMGSIDRILSYSVIFFILETPWDQFLSIKNPWQPQAVQQ